MAHDEPKKFSDELKALRAEFAEVAEKSKAAIAHLNSAIFKQELTELRQEQDKTVAAFAHNGSLESVGNRDVTVLVNKSKDMGHGLNSPLGQAIDAAAKLRFAAQGNYDLNVSVQTFEAGASKGVNISDYDRMDKAREKTEANSKEIVPALREITVANTPDKDYVRNRHYVIITDGSVSDNTDAAARLIDATLRGNPKATFDFISVGAGSGNVAEIVSKVQVSDESRRPVIHNVPSHEGIWTTFTNVLRGRIAQSPHAKPAALPARNQAPTATP
ncbi:MAG TPA: hypothetical protein VEF76_12095 [Patescibacteria group bacterium]|nr:hypothetical protein [Patescibacteria group bacterium]